MKVFNPTVKEFNPENLRGTKPYPMRPVEERIIYISTHFLVMDACTTPGFGWTRRGKKIALIEPVNVLFPPKRIDKRLKSIKQIIAIRLIYDQNHKKAYFVTRQYIKELVELATKCEQLWPCHFLLKGVDYAEPPAHLLNPCSSTEE